MASVGSAAAAAPLSRRRCPVPTAVVTGGTDGIGRALADTYLDRGHEVVAIGTSHEKGALPAGGGRPRRPARP